MAFSFLKSMEKGLAGLGPQHHQAPITNCGPIGFLVNKGERYGAALALGYAKGAYRERLLWWGQPAELLGGIGLTTVAAILKIVAGARGDESALAPHVEALGDTAMTTWLNGVGSVWGHKSQGRTIAILPKGADVSRLPTGSTVVSGLPQAKQGKFLSDEEIARWRAPR